MLFIILFLLLQSYVRNVMITYVTSSFLFLLTLYFSAH